MYDSTARFPETHSILGGRGGEEVIDLLVGLLGSLEVVAGSRLCLDQMVTVNRRGNSNLQQKERSLFHDLSIVRCIACNGTMLCAVMQTMFSSSILG